MECTSAQIAITFVGTEGAGGTFGLAAFTVKARTPTGCPTSGYPGVQLFNNGYPLPNVVKRGSGDLTKAGPPQTVTLTGTQTGLFTIEYLRGANGATCPVVTSVGVIAPDQRQALSLATPTVGVPFTPCGDVTVTPIQASPAP